MPWEKNSVDYVLTTRELAMMIKEAGMDFVQLEDGEFDDPLGEDIKIGVAHGLGNARKLLEDIRAGKGNYHAIEIMACPGGCVGGAG